MMLIRRPGGTLDLAAASSTQRASCTAVSCELPLGATLIGSGNTGDIEIASTAGTYWTKVTGSRFANQYAFTADIVKRAGTINRERIFGRLSRLLAE
jgi:hypothetical protein